MSGFQGTTVFWALSSLTLYSIYLNDTKYIDIKSLFLKFMKLIWISLNIPSRLGVNISHGYYLRIQCIKNCHVETFHNKLSIFHVDIDDIASISIRLVTHIMLFEHCTFVLCSFILCVDIIVKQRHLDLCRIDAVLSWCRYRRFDSSISTTEANNLFHAVLFPLAVNHYYMADHGNHHLLWHFVHNCVDPEVHSENISAKLNRML